MFITIKKNEIPTVFTITTVTVVTGMVGEVQQTEERREVVMAKSKNQGPLFCQRLCEKYLLAMSE